jgi:hypothetical protein
MLISYSKAGHIDKSVCLFVDSCDGCTANPEYQQQQQRQMYILYIPRHALCLGKPCFNGSAMIPKADGEIIICTPPVGPY